MSQVQQTNIQQHILNRFTIIKKIGAGAYGHVWKVEEKITKKVCALKKIFDAFQHSTDAQRTYREIQILKQLQHPNIIKLYQAIKAENNKDVYLVFQFMEADLHNVIAEGILKQVHIRYIVYQLAKALKYLHSGLIIHRDLKPSNILINSNCTIKLCDFGLVRSLIAINDNTPILTEGVATRWYRAPQVLLGSTSYSTPADIWSFGCIVYEILAQKPMFPGESTSDQIDKILLYSGFPSEEQIKGLKSNVARSLLKQTKISNLSQTGKDILKDLPPLLAQLIKKMTAFNPAQRITVEQILNDEVVKPFRKKQEQTDCKKIIMTEISDNKKLTVDEYRNLVYGIKRSQSAQLLEMKVGAKKSSSTTQLNSSYAMGEKYTLKYVKQKDLLKSTYNNKSTQQSINDVSYKKKQEVSEIKKDVYKDPTRVAYISKNFYSPKNVETNYQYQGHGGFISPNSSISYKGGQSVNYPGVNTNSQSVHNTLNSNYSKIGTSYTSSSSYTGQKKPVLFKSSKYLINKTEESGKQ